MSKHSHNHGNPQPAAAQNDAGKENLAENPREGQAGNNEKAQAESPVPQTPEQKTPAPEAEAADPASQLAELEAKLAELNDQYLRKAADFENFRKRMIREKQELTEFANQNLLLDLLPVIDDFERAIKSAQSSPAAQSSHDFASFYEGIVMIEKRLSTQLENKWGLKRFDSAGQPFDPMRHEALQMEKAAGITEAVVKEDFVKGYFLKERVLRCAKVKVLMPENPAPSAGGLSGSAEAPGAGEVPPTGEGNTGP